MDSFMASDAASVLAELAIKIEKEPLNDVLFDCVEVVHQGVADNFAATRAPAGIWPPHSPVTIAMYGPHPLLILDGYLLQSVTKSGSWGNIETIQARAASVGTDLPYAAAQNFGFGRIPARRYMWLNEYWVERLTDTFVNGLISKLGL